MSKSDDITVLDGKVHLKQPAGGFRTSIDAVLLAAACPAQNGEHILDLGCGVGSAGLCALHRLPEVKLTGIDIQGDHVELARENAARNDMAARSTFHEADIKVFEETGFDHVICNPPFEDDGAHVASLDAARAAAIGHQDTDLTDWVHCVWRNIKGRGSLTLIHKAGETHSIIHALGKMFGDVQIMPLYPKAGKAAGRVIIRAFKHKKSPCTIYPGLILHEENGDYTTAAEDILRGGKPLHPIK